MGSTGLGTRGRYVKLNNVLIKKQFPKIGLSLVRVRSHQAFSTGYKNVHFLIVLRRCKTMSNPGVLAIAGHNFVCFHDDAGLEPQLRSSCRKVPVWPAGRCGVPFMLSNAGTWPLQLKALASAGFTTCLDPRVCSWSNDEEHLTSRPIWHVRSGWFDFRTNHSFV